MRGWDLIDTSEAMPTKQFFQEMPPARRPGAAAEIVLPIQSLIG
jgi:hypothetical protein